MQIPGGSKVTRLNNNKMCLYVGGVLNLLQIESGFRPRFEIVLPRTHADWMHGFQWRRSPQTDECSSISTIPTGRIALYKPDVAIVRINPIRPIFPHGDLSWSQGPYLNTLREVLYIQYSPTGWSGGHETISVFILLSTP